MNTKFKNGILEQGRDRLKKIIMDKGLSDRDIRVMAGTLTAQEAIGEPGRRDFPIIIGKERMIEADFAGFKGQAFTDSPAEFKGTLEGIIGLSLHSNRNRGIFVAAMNALLSYLGLTEWTVHCKDEDPEECARQISELMRQRHAGAKVGLIGLNPAIAERLAEAFGAENVRITDKNSDNKGRRRFGVEIWDAETDTERLVTSSDAVIFTGTTLVNDTFDTIYRLIEEQGKDYLVYGVTAAGVSSLFGLNRICPCSRDS